MLKRFESIDNYFVITDVSSGEEEIRELTWNISFKEYEGSVYFVLASSGVKISVHNYNVINILNGNESDSFFLDHLSLKQYLNKNTGKSSSSDGEQPSEDAYIPTVKVSTYSDDAMKTNETITLTIRGTFLDYVNNIVITAQDVAGITFTENIKKYNKIELDISSNSVEQQISVNLESPNNTEVVTIDVSDLVEIIPSTNGSDTSLWIRGTGNNTATLTDGGFSAGSNGDAWDENGTYGGFDNYTTLTTVMTVTSLTNPNTGYCYISFSDRITPSTNQYPSLFINGTIMEIRGNNDQLIAQNISLAVGDVLTIIQTASDFTVLKNGFVQASSGVAYPYAITYINFTAWQTTSFNNIKTTVE